MKKLICVLLLAGCHANMNVTGQSFVGAKYISSPLGEGRAPDEDPIIRFDAFDCTTLVETVLAGGDVDALQRIRYKDGVIGFETRNHFIESDWLENNAERVQNVSAKYAPTKIKKLVIDKRAWFKKMHDINVDVLPQNVEIEYIPYQFANKVKSDQMMIVLFIADNPKIRDTIGTDLAVVHMGLLLPGGVLRHASSDVGCVVDVDFMTYVNARMKNKNNLGIALLDIK